MNASPHSEKNIIHPRVLFILFCISLIWGDVFGSQGIENIDSILIVVCMSCCLFFIKIHYRIILSILLGLSIGYFVWGYSWHQSYKKYEALQEITLNFTKKFSYTGKVEKLVFTKENTNVYLFLIDNFDNIDNFDKQKKWEETQYRKEKIRSSFFIEVPKNLDLHKGDTIEFTSIVKNTLEFPLYGFSRYAYFYGWFGNAYVPIFRVMEKGSLWYTEKVQLWWEKLFLFYFPKDISGTLLGMTIGSISSLSREMKDAFIQSGTSHILVVSGSNIAFLIILITGVLKYFSLKKIIRMSIVWCVLVFYGTLVGWEVSVMRAILMGVISYTIVEYGGKSSTEAILACTGALLTLISPLGPLYDAGFWLSFSATFGILTFHSQIEKWCKWYHIPHTLTSILSVTLGASIGSLPIIIYHFERIPLWGILANILIGGFLGFILFSSIVFVSIHTLSPYIAIIGWYFVYLPTKFIILVSHFFQNWWIIPISHSLSSPLASLIIGFYAFRFIDQMWKKTLFTLNSK